MAAKWCQSLGLEVLELVIGATTFGLMTFSIMTLSIKGLFVTLRINFIQNK
jgi:hypothetical protein